METKNYQVQYANFVCHFGNLELLDYAEEIVIPAFLNSRKRTFKDGEYFFHEVKIINFSDDEKGNDLAICGRFIKSMIVRGEQIFDSRKNTIEKVPQTMETAPSSIFVLLLSSHKLIYLLETKSAPGLESFRSTVTKFLKDARIEHIDLIYQKHKSKTLDQSFHEKNNFTEREITKKLLHEEIPLPELEVIPIANENSLRNFIARFSILQSASLKLIKPNSELDNDDFFIKLREKSDNVGSETSSLIYRNTNGLAKSNLSKQLEKAAQDANTEIRLAGKDNEGQTLRGTNEEFKIISFMEENICNIATTAKNMFSFFTTKIKEGLIPIPSNIINEKGKNTLSRIAKINKNEKK